MQQRRGSRLRLRLVVAVLPALALTTVAACSTPGGSSEPGTRERPTATTTLPVPPSARPSARPSAKPAAKPTSRPTRTAPPHLDTWRVGAHPLPLRPDGFGRVLPTPAQLRVRRLPTADLLPAPRDGRFHATVGPVTPAIRRRMGTTWSPGCPVPLSGLRDLRLTFRGFDGHAHTGELVVSATVADGVVGVFRRLYAAAYPIEEMRLPTTADLDAPPTGDGNNTAAYVCRFTRGTTTLSAHAYGLAIDVNPFLNPYRRGDLVLPELAGAYLDRSWRRPGMILRGGVVTRAFARAGWTWGGDFTSLSDLMHFSADGR
ncbi:MAG: M15 family metallopeptidase [Nocardioidaceae bacterium]